MPKKGYRYPNRNVLCDHCGQLISALTRDRALLLGEHLEHGPADIHEICTYLGISRQLARDVIHLFRRHLAGPVGKAIACAPDENQPTRFVYQLTDQWMTEEGPDIQHNEQWFTKSIGEHVLTARDMATIALQNTDGRRRRQKHDIADLVSVLTSVEERIRFMRERLLILDEDFEPAR